MILKKPYAFLIKYFKAIHLILLAFTIYISLKFNKIVDFFSRYVKNTNIVSEGLNKSLVPPSIFITIILVIIFSALMWLLMYRKNKPSKFYLITGIYYFILLIAVAYSYNMIGSLVGTTITQKTALAYRDIYQLLLIPNFYFIIMSLIRGIGFDVKKFNFGKDLEELEIKSEDNEEFEFVLGTDSYKIKRKTRRYLREFVYYIKENKIFVSIIVGALTLIGIFAIFINITFLNHNYKVGETLKTTNFTYKLNKAYLTAYDYTGKQIKENKKYLVLDFTINSNGTNAVIKPENFYLKVNNQIINYKTSLSESFSDLGISYKNDKITTDKVNNIYIFEIDNTVKTNTYNLTIFDRIKNNGDYIYQNYKIKPQKIDNIHTEESKNINEIIYLNKNIFGNTNITIKNLKITSTYSYTYQNCENNSCISMNDIKFPINSNKNNLLIMEYDLNIDSASPLYTSIINNNKKFFDKFLKISYSVNDKNYTTSTTSQIDSNIPNIVLIDIPKTIQNYQNINIIISTRTDKYTIPIQ